MTDQSEERHVFISYRRLEPDLTFAHKLATDLEEAGHKIWIDVQGIPGGSQWTDELQRAIEACYAFVLILSPDALASRWVPKEMVFALEKKPGRVFPVLFRAVDLPLPLADIQFTDFQAEDNYQRALATLLRALPGPPAKPAEEQATVEEQPPAMAENRPAAPRPSASGVLPAPAVTTPTRRPGSPTRTGVPTRLPGGGSPGPRPGSPSGRPSIITGMGPAGESMPKAARSRPKTRPTQTTTKYGKKARKITGKPDEGLSLDTKLDIIGVALIIGAVVFLLSILSRNPGLLARSFSRVAYQGFGWGGYLVPVGMGAVGAWLIWRHFGDHILFDLARIGGVVLTFVALLTLIHAGVMAYQPIGSVYIDPRLYDPDLPEYTPELVWEKAIACPVRPQDLLDQGWVRTTAHLGTYDIARCGQGGGYVGALFVGMINDLFGSVVTFVVAVAALIGGMMLATRTTLHGILRLFA
jgi:hypothetical protein